MRNKNRLFSHANETNCLDYIREKKGIAQLKAVKVEAPNVTINYFFSYNDFINLTKVYFKFMRRNKCIVEKPPVSILDTNTSLLRYNQIKAHINNCRYCITADINDICLFQCEELKKILYPYGVYLSDQDDCDNMRFPVALDMSKWCVQKECPEKSDPLTSTLHSSFKKEACDCSMYSKRSALFINE